MATKTYRGSCHCGAVRYEADLDLEQGTARCNCTYCTKTGWWGVMARPSNFRLLSGQEGLRKLGTSPVADRPVCNVCGIMAFSHGELDVLGGEYYSVNVRCLDDVDLAGVPVKYLDGRHDTWAELKVEPYVDPFVGAGAPGLKPAWES
jgi:hypothetical protein